MSKMKIWIIPPGQFRVTRDPSIVMETCLGSCIGVCLFDQHNSIGGLIHIILPDARAEKKSAYPARYASSGIPLLLSEMVKAGASTERISAFLVGGAMVILDSRLSVELNIGRKNAAIAKQILASYGIPIVKEDIGGHFGRVVRFRPIQGSIEITSLSKKGGLAPVFHPERKIALKELLEKINRLKPLPEVVRKIIYRIEDYEVSASELEEYILRDQALTANILKAANSPYYGFQGQISNIQRAIVLLGLEELRRIVLSTSLYDIYDTRINGYSLEKGMLMKHSIFCSMVAQLLANLKNSETDVDTVFTAALLHDIGKIVLDQYAFEKFNLIIDMVMNQNIPFIDAENRILGYDHAHVGGLIAEKWQLPEILIEAIQFHHEPNKAKKYPELVSIIHIADIISCMFGEGLGADGMANRLNQFAISCINLDVNDVEVITHSLPEIARRADAFLF